MPNKTDRAHDTGAHLWSFCDFNETNSNERRVAESLDAKFGKFPTHT